MKLWEGKLFSTHFFEVMVQHGTCTLQPMVCEWYREQFNEPPIKDKNYLWPKKLSALYKRYWAFVAPSLLSRYIIEELNLVSQECSRHRGHELRDDAAARTLRGPTIVGEEVYVV